MCHRQLMDTRRLVVPFAAACLVALVGCTPDASTRPTAVVTQRPQPAQTVFRYHVGYVEDRTDAISARLGLCFDAPGIDGATQLSNPPQHVGTVAGQPAAEAFELCVRSVDGVTLRLEPA